MQPAGSSPIHISKNMRRFPALSVGGAGAENSPKRYWWR